MANRNKYVHILGVKLSHSDIVRGTIGLPTSVYDLTVEEIRELKRQLCGTSIFPKFASRRRIPVSSKMRQFFQYEIHPKVVEDLMNEKAKIGKDVTEAVIGSYQDYVSLSGRDAAKVISVPGGPLETIIGTQMKRFDDDGVELVDGEYPGQDLEKGIIYDKPLTVNLKDGGDVGA